MTPTKHTPTDAEWQRLGDLISNVVKLTRIEEAACCRGEGAPHVRATMEATLDMWSQFHRLQYRVQP